MDGPQGGLGRQYGPLSRIETRSATQAAYAVATHPTHPPSACCALRGGFASPPSGDRKPRRTPFCSMKVPRSVSERERMGFAVFPSMRS